MVGCDPNVGRVLVLNGSRVWLMCFECRDENIDIYVSNKFKSAFTRPFSE